MQAGARARLLIVGGGVIGHVLAWRLSNAHPKIEIVLVERDLPGNGASARSAGLHFPLGKSYRTRKMSVEGSSFYSQAIKSGSELPITQVPLRVHCPIEHLPTLREAASSSSELSEATDVGNIHSHLGSSDQVWQIKGANIAQVRKLILKIRTILAERVTFVDGLEVSRLKDCSSPEATLSDGTSISADWMVLAPGPWALSDRKRSTNHI